MSTLGALARNTIRAARLLGIDVDRTRISVKNAPRYLRDLVDYRRASTPSTRFPVRADGLLPMLTDFEDQAGATTGHYFVQDLWAARKIFDVRPSRHVDVGSRVDGFVAH